MTLKGDIERFIDSFIEPDTEYKQSFVPLNTRAFIYLTMSGSFAFGGTMFEIGKLGVMSIVPPETQLIIILVIVICIMYGLFFYSRYSRRPTKFELKYTAIKKFKITEKDYPFGSGRLIVYKEGIEIRVSCRSFFLPYCKITGISHKRKKLGDELRIEINEESVPRQFIILSHELDNIQSTIYAATENIRAEGDETPSETFGRGCKSENTSKSPEQGIHYNNKIIIGILLMELLVMLSTGPVVILCKQFTFKPSQFDRLYTRDEYRPAKSNAPRDYALVEVIYNKKHKVTNEIYYGLDGAPTDSEGYAISYHVFGTMGFLFLPGLFLIGLASKEKDALRKQSLSIYGATACVGLIPLLGAWMALIYWIITPVYLWLS